MPHAHDIHASWRKNEARAVYRLLNGRRSVGSSLANMLKQAASGPQAPFHNALSIDVEDYFQVSAFAPYIGRDTWDRAECRVEQNVERILEMLDERAAHATFFTLGWIAERYPQLVRRIVDGGHELAS